MGKIIQRDFFPDLEKLKAQNDYLTAIENNDIEKLHEIYGKYGIGRRSTRDVCKYSMQFCRNDSNERNKSLIRLFFNHRRQSSYF